MRQPYVPPAHADDDLSAELAKLTDIRDRGVLAEQECVAAKAQVLGL
jgi:hypothetical protein